MKKILLSSLIMLGVCGIAAAQTDTKAAKPNQPATTTIAAAPAPQKAAVAAENDLGTIPVTTTDKEAAATSPRSATQTAQKAEATSVNAAGEVVPTNDAKRKEAKMAAAKAANAQPAGKQN
jgi:hypothetical protein